MNSHQVITKSPSISYKVLCAYCLDLFDSISPGFDLFLRVQFLGGTNSLHCLGNKTLLQPNQTYTASYSVRASGCPEEQVGVCPETILNLLDRTIKQSEDDISMSVFKVLLTFTAVGTVAPSLVHGGPGHLLPSPIVWRCAAPPVLALGQQVTTHQC